MKAALVLLAVLAFPFSALASEDRVDVASEVAALKDWDVTWSGTPFGLMPFLSDRAEAVVRRGEAARPALLEALMREDSFQVAHVILTQISNRPYRATASEWNGLRVTLYADAVIVDPKQRFALVKKWKTEANQPVQSNSGDAPRNLGGVIAIASFPRSV